MRQGNHDTEAKGFRGHEITLFGATRTDSAVVTARKFASSRSDRDDNDVADRPRRRGAFGVTSTAGVLRDALQRGNRQMWPAAGILDAELDDSACAHYRNSFAGKPINRWSNSPVLVAAPAARKERRWKRDVWIPVARLGEPSAAAATCGKLEVDAADGAPIRTAVAGPRSCRRLGPNRVSLSSERRPWWPVALRFFRLDGCLRQESSRFRNP